MNKQMEKTMGHPTVLTKIIMIELDDNTIEKLLWEGVIKLILTCHQH